MKVYKNVAHVAFDHRSNVDNNFKISIAEAIKKIKKMDIKAKFNILLVPIVVL